MAHNVIEIRRKADERGLARLLGRIRDWNSRRIAKLELRALPEHLLLDLGIRRELIDAYVDGNVACPRAVPAAVVPIERGIDEPVHSKAA